MDRRTMKNDIPRYATKYATKSVRLLAAMAWLVVIPAPGRAQVAGGSAKVEAPSPVPQEFLDRLAELAKSAPPPQPLRGDHSIRGRVVTPSGEPLAGVLVRARSTRRYDFGYEQRPFDDEPPPEDTLARSLQSSAKWWYRRRAEACETKTGADGTFAFDHLADVRFELEAWHTGYSVEPLGGQWHRLIAVPTDTSVDFVAIPIVAMRFELRLPDGSMPERASLEIARVGGRGMDESQTWTPKSSIVKLPAGDWNVTALISDDRFTRHALDDGSFASRTTLVTVTPKPGGAGASEVVRIDLLGQPGIEGSVSGPTDSSTFIGSVIAVRLQPGEEPDPSLLDRNRPRGDRTVASELVQSSSDFGQVFRIARIEPGRWLVGAVDDRFETPLASTVVEVGAGVARVDFKLPPHEARPELRVRVLDPDGAPVRDCTFDSRWTVDESNGTKSHRGGDPGARRTIDGAFAIDRARLGSDCILFIENPRFGRKALTLPRDAKELEVRFDAPAAPKLRLAGVNEHAAARDVEVEVEVADEEDPAFGRQPLRFDKSAIAADETVAIGSLQPGTWRVRLLCDARRSNQFGFKDFEVAAATFELAAGPQEITLPFPKLTTLRLAVAAGAKETLSLVPVNSTSANQNRQWRNGTPDAGGVVAFEDLPPGLYEVSASGDRHMVVEVPAAKPIAFVAEAVNALRVVVTDPKGALAKAGLKSGDAIVAVDGREFGNRQQLDWIRQSLKGEQVTLTVDRGGELFEVVVPRSFLRGDHAAGGRLREGAR